MTDPQPSTRSTGVPSPAPVPAGSAPGSRRRNRDQVRKQVRTHKGPLGGTSPERSQEHRSD